VLLDRAVATDKECEMPSIEDQLKDLLDRSDSDPSHDPDVALTAAVAWLSVRIQRAAPDAELPAAAVRCVGDVALWAEVQEDDPASRVLEKIESHIESLRTPLIEELRRLLRGDWVASGDPDVQALRKLLGAKAERREPAPRQRPPGTVPAGPVARFAAFDELPPKPSPRHRTSRRRRR
jgi:hypothetical protein